MSDYARAKRELQLEEDIKWLEAERDYSVQRATNSTIRKFKAALPNKGKRNCYYVLKPRA